MLGITLNLFGLFVGIPYFRYRDNSVHFYNMYIIKMIEIVFSFNVKDTNIFPC